MGTAIRQPKGGKPDCLRPKCEVSALIGILLIVVAPHGAFKEALPIDISLIHFQERDSKPGCFKVMAIILAGVMDENKTRWYGDVHEGFHHPSPLDNRRLNHRDLLTVHGAVETLHRRREPSR